MDRRTLLRALAVGPALARADDGGPLPVAVVGLCHGHVTGFFDALPARPSLRLAGVYDPDPALREGRAARHDLDRELPFARLDELLARARPRIAFVFSDTRDHLPIAQACARAGVHVMVEKPLAVGAREARAMAAAARAGRIHLLVNYETTWRPGHQEACAIARDRARLGPVRKMISHDGHMGPKALRLEPEFIAWLGDPARNGAGALFDFGCYGANLMTWVMDGARPRSVTAVTQRLQPDEYPRVDDEATVALAYPAAQGIIQASWNWPIGRKDLETHGQDGYVATVGTDRLRARLPGPPTTERAAAKPAATEASALAHMEAVVRGHTQPHPLASLENNLVVVDILDAARRSAATGRAIRLA